MTGNVELENPKTPRAPRYSGWQAAIARYFKFEQNRTGFRSEILAGMTTFMTMAYILVVNPLILSDAIFINQPKDLFAELVIATAIAVAIGSLCMGFLANYPFALAPGMGLNAFFAYSVVGALKIDWRLALSAVLVEGLIFIGLTLTNIRRQLIEGIPGCLKTATAVGIGLFIAYIGLSGDPKTGGAGLIIASPATKTTLGNFQEPVTLIAVIGLLISFALVVRRIKGALLWGILITALLGWLLGVTPWPQGIIQVPSFPINLFGQALIGLSHLNANNFLDFLAVMFVFLFVDIFDTIGTLSGVGTQAGYIREDGTLPRANQALMADAIATTAGAVMGTSTVTTFAESAAGVAEGGRTGFTAVIVAALFLVALLFSPIFTAIPAYATMPTLVMVGVFMVAQVSGISWNDLSEAIPSFLTIFMIPLTYSIASGLSIGFISYPLIKTFQGKGHEVKPITWILAAVFVARFIFMTVRFGSSE